MLNTTNVYSENGWQALGMAIIKQCVDDWRMAQHRAKRPHGDTYENGVMIRECEKFLRSPYPEFYSDVNGGYILRKLYDEVIEASS